MQSLCQLLKNKEVRWKAGSWLISKELQVHACHDISFEFGWFQILRFSRQKLLYSLKRVSDPFSEFLEGS